MASLRSGYQETPLPGWMLTVFPVILILGLTSLGLFSMRVFRAAPSSSPAAPVAAPVSAALPAGTLAGFFSPSVLHWSASVEQWARDYGLDANLVATVMQIESCGDPQALSSAGARGLFQVMPFHFQDGEDASDPATNALRGLSYLKSSLDASGGDVRKALAGYNGGISVVNQPEAFWPSETQRYVDWGSRMYAEASSGHASSQTLQEWLNSGGSSLCGQASQKLLVSKP